LPSASKEDISTSVSYESAPIIIVSCKKNYLPPTHRWSEEHKRFGKICNFPNLSILHENQGKLALHRLWNSYGSSWLIPTTLVFPFLTPYLQLNSTFKSRPDSNDWMLNTTLL
jgi:hypothetical protein